MSLDYQTTRQRFEEASQGHIFAHWDALNEAQKEQLLSQANSIDLAEIAKLVEKYVLNKSELAIDFSSLSPAPYKPLPEKGGSSDEWQTAYTLGEDILRQGKVAAFTVAGGQGTRLGFDGPKGTFPASPIRKASLFQIFAEKIIHASRTYGCTIPWFIMTSKINNDATIAFFKENNFFGLNENPVHFFSQGLMPAVDYEGKLFLEDPCTIAMSPDGHGGALRALVRSGATAVMAEQGIDTISYFQVDNPLVKPLDPAFIGFHHQASSDMSSKMVEIAYAGEKVGHFCSNGQNMQVVEYSDMPENLVQEKDDSGALRFRAGSIAIHILNRAFVEKVGGGDENFALPFHRADKKIAHLNAAGESVKPSSPNGVKFEMFVFDALPFAQNPVVIETDRKNEFSPVKNAEGVDSPKSSREDQMRQYARWAKEAGVTLTTDETGLPSEEFEVTPLFAIDAASFKTSANGLKEIAAGSILTK